MPPPNRLKKLAFWLFVAVAASGLTVQSSDQIESLIDKQKQENRVWDQEDNEDLPVAFLFGDSSSILLYSAAANRGRGNALSEPFEFDELIQLSRGNPADSETVLNTDLVSLREAFEQHCLVRPGDVFVAVGPSWQQYVEIKDFAVRKDRPICASDSPYSLWARFEEGLPGKPLFYSTDTDLPQGDNHFVAASTLPKQPLSDDLKERLMDQIKFAGDYDMTTYLINAPNCDRLLMLHRRIVSPDDAELPNDLAVSEKSGVFQRLLVERVQTDQGTGHIQLDGVLDYNGDGRIDLLFSGDHAGCPYQALFEGTDQGFDPVDLPNKACAC